jgi:hypothetical protein
MATIEELVTKTQRANTIIEDGLNATDILKIPKLNKPLGIIIIRFDAEEGVCTTGIGAINFKVAIKALKDWDNHKQEYEIKLRDEHG